MARGEIWMNQDIEKYTITCTHFNLKNSRIELCDACYGELKNGIRIDLLNDICAFSSAYDEVGDYIYHYFLDKQEALKDKRYSDNVREIFETKKRQIDDSVCRS